MYKGKRILAVVPARGGSKGIPRKNVYPLKGRPLIAYTGDVVRQMGIFDRAVVSTDDSEIAEIAKQNGLSAPFLRPAEFSGDLVSDYPVLRHALETMERMDSCTFDIVVMLQPTSPLRQASHVQASIDTLIQGNWDAVWTVSETDSKLHPQKQLVMTSEGGLDYFDPQGPSIVARQQLTPVYHRNGVAYAITRQCLLEQKNTKGRRTGYVLIREPVVNIDTVEDMVRAELILTENRS